MTFVQHCPGTARLAMTGGEAADNTFPDEWLDAKTYYTHNNGGRPYMVVKPDGSREPISEEEFVAIHDKIAKHFGFTDLVPTRTIAN